MKIRLSEDEVYEIKMPEEIGIQDFQAITEKFNFLLKNFMKFSISSDEDEEEGIVLNNEVVKKTYKIQNKQDRQKWNTIRDNRELFVELLKAHYLKPTEYFYKFTKMNNINFKKSDMGVASMVRIKEMHKIQPQEVGLKRFPTKLEQVRNLILKSNETGEK